MQVTLEDTSTLERRMRVQIPEDRVKGEIVRRLNSLAARVRVPGFRPGKAPLKVLEKRFGEQVRSEVVGEMVQSSFYEAISQQKLRPAGAPTIDPLQAEPGNGIDYTAVFDVYPDLQTPPVESLKIARPVAEVTDGDVNKMLEILRRQRRTWQPAERAATSADRVVIDFQGSIDGAPLDKASGKEVPVELDGSRMIQGFEEGLVGLQAGEEKTLELTFPKEYPDEAVAGKPVTFAVKVHRVEEPLLPSLDDNLAESFGVKEGGLVKLREEVTNNMTRELDDALRAMTKRRVMEALLQGQEITLPDSLVAEEVGRAIRQRKMELSHSGVDPETAGLEPAIFEEPARTRVALGLLLAEIIRSNEIKPDPDRVRGRIESIASTYEDPSEVINWYYGDRSRLADIETSVLEEQVVEWILERAQVSEEASSFDELLNPGQTSS
ncbi:MAG: trigger factor [Gammaproteobacteria bacterium]|nr:trigger factor [Gammaproteobacteria bacterium]